MAPDSTWLAGLKKGDLVALVGPRSRNLYAVQRLTDKQALLTETIRFRRSDGLEVGGIGRTQRRIEQPTQDDLDRREATTLRAFVKRKMDCAITMGKLRAVAHYLGYRPPKS